MIIDRPKMEQIPELKALWQQAFGDTEWFVEGFLRTGFSPDRCRCVTVAEEVAAALYWFDCTANGEKFAYIYAVATEISHRGKGLCRALMENTHAHLAENGYAGAVLVPAGDHLWVYYGKLGYTSFGGIRAFTETAGDSPENVRKIDSQAYTAARKSYLPDSALCQAQALAFFETWGGLYRGEDFIFAAALDGQTLYVQEFLGNAEKIPGILQFLGAKTGHFRTVGGDTPCGMHLLFSSHAAPPSYLGFPLD